VRILFLSQRVPFPPNRGDKITTWRVVDRLRRSHEVRVVAFAHDEADLRAAEKLREMGIPTAAFGLAMGRAKVRSLPLLLSRKPLTLGVFGSVRMQAEVDRWAAESEVGWAYSSSMAAFLMRHEHLVRIMQFSELDSDKWLQYAERTRFPASWIYRREGRTLLEFERRVAHTFDDNIFCTPLEQRIFEERIPGAPSVVIRNGVDMEHFRPDEESREPGHIVFTGVMDYYPNVEGCAWFAREVLPRIRAERPDARFSIIGAHPTAEVRRLDQLPGVEVTGFVEDVRDWMRRGELAVAPLRIARGIQNKVLEAMAAGLPVVGTSSATQGVGGVPGRDYLVADDVDSQVDAILSLLRDSSAARELGRRARVFVETHHDWETILDQLDELLARCTAARYSSAPTVTTA
jgi:sugar transferase (PEP-CTERM/EpsH1 system associated)